MADASDASPSPPDTGTRDDRDAVARDDHSGAESVPSSTIGRPARTLSPLSSGSGGSAFTLDRIVRFLLGAAAVALAGWVLWYFAGLVLYLAVGGLLAYLLRPIVDWLQSVGLSRVSAILATFVLVLSGLSVLVTSVVPFVGQQVRDLSQLISVDMAADAATYIESRVRPVVPIEKGILVDNVKQMGQALVQGDLVEGARVAQTVSSVVAVFTNIVYAVVIIPFVTFFLLKDGLQIRRSLMWLVPNRYFEVTLAIADKVEGNIGRYFRALLIQCTSIAVIASVLLWIVGLQSAIAIGIFTGLANTIPYFGPFLGFLCGTLVGIAQTGNLALVPWVALAMVLTQLADNVLLQPLIFSRAAKAHPLVILFVVLIGARLGGIVGMLIAIPLTTTIRVVVEQLLWSLRNYRILRSPS
jgi:predicted PurR-regulated permease PerM